MGIAFRRNGRSPSDENSPLLGPDPETKRKRCAPRNVALLLLVSLVALCAAVTLTFALLGRTHVVPGSSTDTTQSIPSPDVPRRRARLTAAATVNDDYFEKCAPPVTCDPDARYRTVNGSCNNLENPTWGAAMTPFYRHADPEFSDGISTFRAQSDGSPLPNARRLALTLFQNTGHVCDHRNNELLVPWGQFVAHDMAYSPVNSINSTFPDALEHCDDESPPTECQAVIKLSPDDPVYGKYNMTFLKFMRVVTSSNYSCPLVPVTVLNQNTHYVDASNVYGSNDRLANELRLFSGGQLAYDNIGNQQYCPQDPSKIVRKGNRIEKTVSFVAGDVNVNQNLAIALFQNLFLRFHNHVAGRLQLKHPRWTDETTYQETRRIVAAVVQVITYDHFLPIVLGEQYVKHYGLNSETNYDPTITVSVSQEMTSGAYRLLHNIIPAQYNYMASNYTVYAMEEPSKLFLKPDSLLGNFDDILRGLMETPGREPQSSYNDLITNIVIQSPKIKNTTGFDLLSYDIQRGRDVGLPPYNKMRRLCGSSRAKSFDDLSDHIPSAKIDMLKTLYSSVDDIDFYVGMLLESRTNGSMVGPTGSCVIADSFYRSRHGDRFFYDVRGQPGSFTQDQIDSLKKITLSHLICATSGVEHVQTDTFSMIDHVRMMRLKPSCETYHIDLSAW